MDQQSANGVWEGVPISSLLQAARPASDAAHVLLEGADSGRLIEDAPPLPYSQVVPIERCREASALIAFKYNDLTLPKRNGFPARALFPGSYGMNSVKWLRRIAVLPAGEQDTTFDRSGMSQLYNRVTRRSDREQITRVSTVQVKSAIAWPTDGLKLPAGHYSMWGFAWSGAGAIRHLSISVDGGKQWNPGKLQSQANPRTWVRWTYEWDARPGDYAVMSRAADSSEASSLSLEIPRAKMDMNLITACRFTAACAKFRIARIAAGALVFCTLALASDCATGLSDQEKITQFKKLDGEAESAMQQHRPAEAVRFYEDAVCLVPNSARGYYGLGVAEAAAGEFLNARDSLHTADRLQPTTGMPLVMQVRVNFSLGDIETLKSNLRQAATRFPQDAELHTILARFLAERNLFVLALAEAMRARQDSSDWNASVQLAVLENTVGAYDDAIRNALAIEQNHAIPQQVRGAAAGVAGLSYESLHQIPQAVRYLNEAIELDGSQTNSYLALADLFEQQQRYEDAVNVLEQAREHVADSSTVQLPLGADLIRAEHYKEGLAILRELLKQAPDTPEAYISIADASRKTGDAAQEVSALRGLERQNHDYPMIHVMIARAMLSEQPPDYSKILDELSIAAKNTPNDPDVYFLRGKVYVA